MSIDRYITIDEEGYFMFDGQRVDDETYGRQLQKNIKPQEKNRFTTSLQGQEAWLEYFDAPLVARHVKLKDAKTAEIDIAYNNKAEFSFAELSVDEWDRFHGVTSEKIPFVFSRQAQFEFFDLLDAFDDDSITVKGKKYPVPPWLLPFAEANKDQFWTNIYQNENPGWELHGPTPILKDILPQIRMSKAKILALGCGSGHDAAFLAEAGHMVTGVDISSAAIGRAKELYGRLENLSLLQADAFNLPDSWTGQFDVVFEHTCYCAISPERRNELVKTWRRVLQPQGHLLAVFFAYEKREGPPFGGSEWEIRERLKGKFNFLYWTRWHHSLEERKSRELVVYARKTD